MPCALTTDGWHFRPFVPADTEPLADLWVEAWQKTGLPIDFAARRSWFLERLAEHIAGKAQVYLACPQGSQQLAGFFILDPQVGYLDQIAVAPSFQGTGLAVRLIDLASSMTSAPLGLVVNQDNHRAVKFYLSHGFAIIGEGISAASGLKTWTMTRSPDSRKA